MTVQVPPDQPSGQPIASGQLPLLAALWGCLFALALLVNVQTQLADARAHGLALDSWEPLVWEGSSILLWIVLLPIFYRLHRSWPLPAGWKIILVHMGATVPISLCHVYGMFALRSIVYDTAGRHYPWPDLGVLVYEYRKDVVTYVLLSGVILAIDHVLSRRAARTATPPPPPGGRDIQPAEQDAGPGTPPAGTPPVRLERFAVRRKGKEVLISIDDILWIEAAGNYAILHVGAERFEIRSTLAKLERELDPDRFVRTHKSSIVNLAKVREVEPWFSGDYRIVLEGGGVVNLSRRYRSRFETVVPVKR